MNNEVYGLCSKCIQKVDTQQPHPITYVCQKCKDQPSHLIFNDSVLCVGCYLKEKNALTMIKKSGMENSSVLTLVPKVFSSSFTGSFLNRNGKVIKKIEKMLSSSNLKTNEIVQELQKKSMLACGAVQPTAWQKIVDKCHKCSGLIYFFVGKQVIFGGFHLEAVKISSTTESSLIEDNESGLFLTERSKYDLNIYKTSKSLVKYSQKSKSIMFGDPPAFQIIFRPKQIAIKSQLQGPAKWQYFFVYKI